MRAKFWGLLGNAMYRLGKLVERIHDYAATKFSEIHKE